MTCYKADVERHIRLQIEFSRKTVEGGPYNMHLGLTTTLERRKKHELKKGSIDGQNTGNLNGRYKENDPP